MLRCCQGIENVVEPESDSDTNCNWCSCYSRQRINTGTRGLGNMRTSWDHPNYSAIKIGLNTEKSPGDLRRLAVTQIPVKNHPLTLVWKALIIIKNILTARIQKTLSRYPSQLVITLGMSCSRHSVSAQSSFMYIFAGWPTLLCL